MPAQRNSSSSSIPTAFPQFSSLTLPVPSLDRAANRQQFDAEVADAARTFNLTRRQYARGSHAFTPYPSNEEVFLRSSSAINDADEFDDLSISDFFLAQRRVAQHRHRRFRNRMNEAERALFGRVLERMDNDVDEEWTSIMVSSSYTSSVAMGLLERNVALEDRVSLICLLIINTFADKSFDRCVRQSSKSLTRGSLLLKQWRGPMLCWSLFRVGLVFLKTNLKS